MFTTTATREVLSKLNLPDSLPGNLFRVTVTPIEKNEIDSKEEIIHRFRALKGVLGKAVSVDDIRKERLSAYID